MKIAIAEAIVNKNQCKPCQKQGPYEMIVHYTSTNLADSRFCDGVDSIRLDGLKVLYKDTDLIRLFVKAI
jgi:D-amino peptidase